MTHTIETIQYFGECTAYSAKGHFKSADLRRILTYLFAITNIIFSILSLLDFVSLAVTKWLGAACLFSSFKLLMYSTKDEADFASSSMKAGEEYLKLHNDILVLHSSGSVTQSDLELIKERLNELNTKPRPPISFFAKYWAKYSIEKMGEMNIWWK